MTKPLTDVDLTRREMLAMAVVGGAGLAISGASSAEAAGATSSAASATGAKRRFLLTVLGTTDLHGHVYNWDYYTNAEFDNSAHDDIGVAKVATLIKAVRAERGARSCLTIDAGDTIQGTPLSYYYAVIDPITGGSTHPMAAAMNAVRYDAAALGNHEFNYGMDTLRAFERQCRFPLLAANAVGWRSGRPVFRPYVIRRVHVPGHEPVRVGILGLVTPGVAIWDKANVEGRVRFPGIVEQARVYVPRLRAAGADVVIVSAHSGADTSSSYGDALPYPENASTLLAEQVRGIDAILVGHAHKEIAQRFVTNTATGRQVLLSEPYYWGARVTVMDLALERTRGRWRVVQSSATLLNSNAVPEDPAIAALVRPAHERVLTYVNSPIGSCLQAMSAATSRYEDTAAMDFINVVQAGAVKAALAGTPEAALPVLSIAAPFNKAAAIPQGEVTVRDVAGLYIYDNTLLGIVLTGEQIRAYLEKSAEYFKQVTGPGPFAADDVTNAVTPSAPGGTPDYNYDILGGLDAALAYDIDIAAAPGGRITNLLYGGSPVA
ncbi:MAG TPA: 5'-nucleotidase C-terminal domain-containing protein, partial [Candidatus Lustribacter sp.]|nr:5'-nucleotidase C-terminal domain-containing protein [Candidatus Lustribacter sp.]